MLFSITLEEKKTFYKLQNDVKKFKVYGALNNLVLKNFLNGMSFSIEHIKKDSNLL